VTTEAAYYDRIRTKRLAAAEAEVERLRLALGFYADEDHYQSVHYLVPEVNEDEGQIAREALEQSDKC